MRNAPGREASRPLPAPRRESALGREVRAALFATSTIWAIFAFFMVFPAVADLVSGSGNWTVFAMSIGLIVTVAGMLGLATRAPTPPTTQRFGFILVALIWTTGPVAGAVPFVLFGMSPTDALFEAVSGLTTTGSTVMAGLDAMPPGILLWRSITHFLGGVGILLLAILILPFLQIGGMQLFSKESSDQSGKPVPRFAAFTRTLFLIYLGLVALCTAAYDAAGMTAFDALNHAMATLGTGGFSTHDASMGFYKGNQAILWVGTVFMAFGALPFSLYVAAVSSKRGFEFDPQVTVFFGIVAAAALSLSAMREGGFSSYGLAESFFNAMSVITTTGFASTDYLMWGPYAVALFYVITYFGGCAGSTSGGVKIYRLIVVFETMRAHLARLISPSAVAVTRYGRRQVDPAVFRSAMVFLIAYAVVLQGLTLAVAACGVEFVTAHSGVLTALSNVGPGVSPLIGPVGNFSTIPEAAKWILIFAMLLGRLEILPVLALLMPAFWRR
jgi:trk system potassium uptake protein TrkH